MLSLNDFIEMSLGHRYNITPLSFGGFSISPKDESESICPVTYQENKGEEKTMDTSACYTIPEINNVVHNEEKGSTTINWSDGTKTTVRVMADERYDKYNGFCAAVMKKLFGTTTMAKRIRDRKDIKYIKAVREEERKKAEAAAEKRREVAMRRAAKRIAKETIAEMKIQAMADEIIKDYTSSL